MGLVALVVLATLVALGNNCALWLASGCAWLGVSGELVGAVAGQHQSAIFLPSAMPARGTQIARTAKSPVTARNGLFSRFYPSRCLSTLLPCKIKSGAPGRVWGDFLSRSDASNRPRLLSVSNFRSFLCRRGLNLPVFGDLTPSRCCYTRFDAPARIWAGFARLGAFLAGRSRRIAGTFADVSGFVACLTACSGPWGGKRLMDLYQLVLLAATHSALTRLMQPLRLCANGYQTVVVVDIFGKWQWCPIPALVEQRGQPEAPSSVTGGWYV